MATGRRQRRAAPAGSRSNTRASSGRARPRPVAPGSGVPSGRPTQTPTTCCRSKPNAQASRPPQLVPVFQAMPGRAAARERLRQDLGHQPRRLGLRRRRARADAGEQGQRPGARALASPAYRPAISRIVSPAPPSASGSAGSAPAGRRGLAPRVAQRFGEAQRPDLVQQRDRRQVQRPPQRLGRRDLAGVAAGEVLRRVAAEVARQVGERACPAAPGRPRTPAHTGTASAPSPASAPPASGRATRPAPRRPSAPRPAARISRRARVGDQQRQRRALRQRRELLAGHPLQRRLQRQVERGPQHRPRCRARASAWAAWRGNGMPCRAAPARPPPRPARGRAAPRRARGAGPGAAPPAGAAWRPAAPPAPGRARRPRCRTRPARRRARLRGCRHTARGSARCRARRRLP